jgi:prophage regulatory protein
MNAIRLPLVIKKTGLSRMTIYRLENRGEFPQRKQLSPNSVGWLESEIDEWIASRSAKSRIGKTATGKPSGLWSARGHVQGDDADSGAAGAGGATAAGALPAGGVGK